MKRCLTCNEHYPSPVTNCPSCGFGPAFVDGFCSYAPELLPRSVGFKASHFAVLYQHEENNFWFSTRNLLIIWALKKYCPELNSFLEIGCGTGYVLTGIAKAFPHINMHGSEIFTAGLSFASARLPSISFMQMDARRIPYINEFDTIGAFDVLEHIEEDEQVLAQIYSALKPYGLVLITVPQHPWLWSATDKRACHVRRYTGVDLHRKIEAAGFHILRSTSFVTILLPAMMVSRFSKKKIVDDDDARAELTVPPWLNTLFSGLMRIELALIRMGWSFPVGGSRLVIARKI